MSAVLDSPLPRALAPRATVAGDGSKTPRRIDIRGAVLPLVLLAVWWTATQFHWVDTRLIVPPGQVVAALVQTLQDALFYQGVAFSIARDLAGFALGSVLGIALGLALGLSRWADRLVGPSFHTLRQISLFAWLPLLSSWLGYGEGAKLVFIAVSVLYPVALNTVEGVRSISPAQHDVARVFGFTRWQLLWRLILPAASPQIATGLTLGLVYAWVATIGAEFLLANWGHGLGNLIIKARAAFNVELIVIGMLAIGLIGTALNRAAGYWERRALHWRGVATPV